MRKDKVEDVLVRLSAAIGTTTDTGLAKALGTTSSTISSWKARDSIPYAKCVEVANQKGLSLDWLLTGEGSMRRAKASEGQQAGLSPRDQGLLDLFHSLDEEAQREIQSAAEEKKRIKDMERQLKELSLRLDRFNSAG